MYTKEIIFGKTLQEIQEIIHSLHLPSYTANQICSWMYKKHVKDFNAMTNLSKKTREMLREKYRVDGGKHEKVSVALDQTKKYLFRVNHGLVEAAYIPEEKRSTLCLSSQIGCKRNCLFCMTGKQKFTGNLTGVEILNQYENLPERESVTNIVYMGMGEPLDNFDEVMKSLEIFTAEYGYAKSPSRITVSTIGIIPHLKTFLERSLCSLAVSIHTPFDDERASLMPVQKVYPIKEVIALLKKYDFSRERKLTFEYTMFRGINDSQKHIKQLARLLNGLKCRINLLNFHPIPNTKLESTDLQSMEWFRDGLKKKGIMTTIRRSRGLDITAACGLLSTKEMLKTL